MLKIFIVRVSFFSSFKAGMHVQHMRERKGKLKAQPVILTHAINARCHTQT